MAAAVGIVELGGQTGTRPPVAGSATSGGEVPLPLQLDGTKGSSVMTAWEVLEGKKQAGTRVLIAGGGMIGCEVADFLGEHLHRVTIVEMLPSLAQDLPPAVAHFLLRRLSDYNVEIITNARIAEILEDGVIIRRNGKKMRLEGFDTLVLALGIKSVNGLAAQIEGKVPEIYVIGDAVTPRRAIEAIEEGAKIALRV
jgi:pyruvate/2-oxoglutarate dehydrogenase complex dihydrolipoamide dehydrogenase (E3) component